MPSVTGCVHHHMLPAPDGPMIPGVCKLCGHKGEWPAQLDIDCPLRKRKRNKAEVQGQKTVNAVRLQERLQQRPWKYESLDG